MENKNQIMTDMPYGWTSFWRVSRYLWVALILIGLAFIFEKVHQARDGQNVDPIAIESLIKEEFSNLEQELDEIISAGDSLNRLDYIDREDLVVYIFHNDSLIFWSNNSIALPLNVSPDRFHPGYLRLPNVFALCSVDTLGSKTIAAIRPIQYRFPFENEFLSNRFLLGGNQFQRCELVPLSTDSGDVINGTDGEPWFRVVTIRDGHICFYWLMSIVIYAIGIILILVFMLKLLRLGFGIWNSVWWLVFFAADLVIFRWIISFSSLPKVFHEGSLFDLFAQPLTFFESQGDSLISLFFLLVFAIAIKIYWKIYPASVSQNKDVSYRTLDAFTAAAWLMISGLWFFLYRFWIWLLSQSNELLEIHDILALTQDHFVNLLLVGLSGGVFLIVLFTVIKQAAKVYPLARFALIPVVTGMIFFAITRYSDLGPSFMSLMFLFLITISCALSYYGSKKRLNQVSILLIIIFSSLCIIFFVNDLNKEKEKSIQIEIIDDLSNVHDETAENLLKRMDESITQDTTLSRMILDPNIPEADIKTYVQNSSLGPYWSRYEINVMVCDSVNMLNFSTGNLDVVCLPYWNEIVSFRGQKIGDSHFYYIDNLDGLFWYTGIIPFFSEDSSYTFHLIIDASSALVPEGLGYPDVLIADETEPHSIRDNYSYAQYLNCMLVSRSGDFNYSSSCQTYPSEEGEVVYFKADGYEHCSQLTENNLIVLSKPNTSFFSHLISFSYLFVAFYLYWLIISSIIILPKRIKKGLLDLKFKIQISMVGTLVVSFLLIGGGMSYFIIKQYSNNNRGTINEKIQSVLIELIHKLELEEQLSPEWSGGDYPNLQALLVKFSFVFNTDINMYSPEGELLASSRPEVFRRNLTGRLMNSQAYYDLDKLNRMKLIHRENIGSLGFWSAYVPFYNIDKELLAYLNLPYFSKQSELSEEVSTFLVAMFNVYFLLILIAVFVAILLGNQLTKPLQMLQEKFSGMHLGAKNTEIEYQRNDEIGGLLRAYNQMVMELETSADLLAKSERESAWREMAKQIAHEIKNPLTPMKLSVQHLKRSWDDKVENWDAYLDRVTNTLVEQIDSLTAIANEFSQFAKMPKAKREEIDLRAKVENIIALFRESGKSAVSFEVVGDGPFQVFLDKEQIRQVLTNLITNALQSIPQERDPEVIIRIQRIQSTVRLSVQDNGSGINEDQQEKLFQPNFTTKTSGMGLGLAISKNIIDDSDGSIWFETNERGSTFFVELPLI